MFGVRLHSAKADVRAKRMDPFRPRDSLLVGDGGRTANGEFAKSRWREIRVSHRLETGRTHSFVKVHRWNRNDKLTLIPFSCSVPLFFE